MTINHQQGECDERLLRRYLDDALSVDEQQFVEQHLCECSRCRSVISESAADARWWGHAGEYLRGDCWDEMLETGRFSTSIDPSGRGENQHPLAMRQIKEWLDPTDDPRMLGRFGGYEIVGIVGQGGMGVVLKGFEPALNRYVAIKVLAPLLATSGAARLRFAREAKATAAVLHDNVIPIHRVDEDHDLPYLVMPYVSDRPLQKRIDDEGPLPLVAILRIGEQIAAGLGTAHAHGLVHRDIKPANILLENGVERVRITDFGLARAADDGSLTRTGVIAGTPQYMSPEQARGESVDARSDLFSLGSVMYAMSTGRLPFRAETPYGILRRISDTEPRAIRQINPELPTWLEAIIAKLHAKRAADRYESAVEVADLLQRCLAHVEQPVTVPLPVECQDDSTEARSDLTSRPWSWAANRWQSIVLLLIVALVVSAVAITQIGWQPNSSAPAFVPEEKLKTDDIPSAPLDTASNDPVLAWEATAADIAHVVEETTSLESEAEKLWTLPPVSPAAVPNSEATITSTEESNP